MKTCVIIPAYNESAAIAMLVKEIRSLGLDTVVVDDGSNDGTGRIASNGGALLLENARNEGKGASLIKGFEYALGKNYDAVVTMDGDGQHRPEEIVKFIAAAKHSGAGLILGNRMSDRKNMPLARVFTNKFMSWLISAVTRQRIPDSQCGFRLMKAELLRRINLNTCKYETESEILIKAARLGYRIESLPIQTVYAGEKSSIHPVKDTIRFFKFLGKELWTT